MTTLTLDQPLPFDFNADWLKSLADILASIEFETISSSRVVIVGKAGTDIAGWSLVVTPQTSFGLTFSSPYVTGAIGGIQLVDPDGAVVASVTDLPGSATVAAFIDGSVFSQLLLEVAGSFGDDSVTGGVGTDTLSGGTGLDLLKGDGGDDSLSGGAGFDYLQGNMGADTLSGGADEDWVVGGKDGDLMYGDGALDLLLGNLGNDTCDGGEGSDIVRGGQGDDLVLGQAGDDWLSGDRGSDTITGGTGADIFHTFDGAGTDRVTDFSAAEGDRVLLLPGTDYDVAQVGADTVITVTGAEGGTLILVGVTMTGLPDGWIFGA